MLLLFSTSRVKRISIMELWNLPHSSSFCCRYHIMLSRCTLIVFALASSSSSSGLLAVIAPPSAHRVRSPNPRFARFFSAMVDCASCRTCSACARFRIAKLSSRISCFVCASISVRWASVKYFLSLSRAGSELEEPVRASCFRRGGWATER